MAHGVFGSLFGSCPDLLDGLDVPAAMLWLYVGWCRWYQCSRPHNIRGLRFGSLSVAGAYLAI